MNRIHYKCSQFEEIGACDPLLFWDPIGALAVFSLFGSSNPPALQGYCGGDCTKEDFDRRRAVELKHGRICMFATIGSLARVLDMVDLGSC